ncbi:MAG: flagellar hook-basal body complex protein FliE [Gammaproteobacteria bacterium]|nr:flagellar hook-basal body complex protein FliE [Gammaproteobacteria bacterium]MBT3490607.1 flagellar hook-basal body complex protein FliE [Gammaproteobacteria bacterium]MBT3718041.1 flagellar hook-basal body complex protein FliE [Gammaproteobacteria bacterium]MBT3844874.1 flagellar hook-basal body complex protein FliE [Gammaproteobacteria bacterium]MBT3891985.1 flagellar hook-basal body complex protein FliE [Gammaproteobacteria bacterium]
MNDLEMNRLLTQMRTLSSEVQGSKASAPVSESNPSEGPDFSALLKESVHKVNEVQHEAGNLKTSFEQGDPETDLGQVMVAVQKADVSFQAATQVRNKLITAYQEIMNMQL